MCDSGCRVYQGNASALRKEVCGGRKEIRKIGGEFVPGNCLLPVGIDSPASRLSVWRVTQHQIEARWIETDRNLAKIHQPDIDPVIEAVRFRVFQRETGKLRLDLDSENLP